MHAIKVNLLIGITAGVLVLVLNCLGRAAVKLAQVQRVHCQTAGIYPKAEYGITSRD